jgi:hypothetical protein
MHRPLSFGSFAVSAWAMKPTGGVKTATLSAMLKKMACVSCCWTTRPAVDGPVGEAELGDLEIGKSQQLARSGPP